MITLEIKLQNDTVKIVKVDSYNPQTFEEALNNRETFMIAIGNAVFNKNMIQLISPVEEATV